MRLGVFPVFPVSSFQWDRLGSQHLQNDHIVPFLAVRLLKDDIPHDKFTFTIDNKVCPTSTVEAVLLSPTVGEQLQVDACAREFDLCVSGMNSIDFFSLHIVVSGKEVVVQKSHQKSFIQLSQQLLNVGCERLFYGLWGDSSSIDAAVTLSSDFVAHSHVYLQSIL
jgi:hypothetical protein